MNDDERLSPSEQSVSMMLRIDGANGSVHTITRDAGGIETMDCSDGGKHVCVMVRIGVDGTFTIFGRDDDGNIVEPPEPIDVTATTNLYGIVVERSTYRGGLVVEHTFDDEGRRFAVRAAGAWGDVAMALQPDGASSITWESAQVRGVQRWSSDRVLVVDDVHVG